MYQSPLVPKVVDSATELLLATGMYSADRLAYLSFKEANEL